MQKELNRPRGGVCRTLTAREYKEPTCVAPSESEDEEAMTASTDGTSSGRILTMKKTNCKQVGMLSGGKWDKMHDISRRVYDTDGVAPTIHTMGGGKYGNENRRPRNRCNSREKPHEPQ